MQNQQRNTTLKWKIFVFLFLFSNELFGVNYQRFIDSKTIEEKCLVAEELSQIYIITHVDSLRILGEKLFGFSTKQDFNRGINVAYFILGQYYARKGEEEKAIGLLREAYTYFVSIQDFDFMVKTLNVIGIAYYYNGNYQEACSWFKKSLEYGNDVILAKNAKLSLVNLAQSYEQLEKYDLALKYAEEYKDWGIKLGLLDFATNAYAVLGKIKLSMNDFDEAEEYFELSYSYADNQKDVYRKSIAYTNIAIVKFLKDEIDECAYYFEKALQLSLENGNITNICDAYLNYGGILFELKKYKQAILNYEEGIGLARKYKKYNNEFELLKALKEVYLIYNPTKVDQLDDDISQSAINQLKEERGLSIKYEKFLLKVEEYHNKPMLKGETKKDYYFHLLIVFCCLFLLFFIYLLKKKKAF